MPGSPATYVFADIAGFTALTEAHGDEEAVGLIDRFCAEVAEILPRYAAAQVKSIGDAVMLRVPDAAAAVELGLDLAHETLRGHHSPAVRVGMHYGVALSRDDDYFGSAVNLAARISARASASEVLLSASTGFAAGAIAGVSYEARGRHELKGVSEPVELVAAVRAGSRGAALAVDPVCQMTVEPETAAALELGDGTTMFESAAICLQLADINPAAGLIPPPGSSERALVYQWVVFAVAELEAPLFRWICELGEGTPESPARDRFIAAAAAMESALEARDWLLGVTFTVADVMCASVLQGANARELLRTWPRLEAYVQRSESRPAYARAAAISDRPRTQAHHRLGGDELRQ